MTENIDKEPLDEFEQDEKTSYLYTIVKLENVIAAAGWDIIYVGLLQRYLCHEFTGAIIEIFHDEPMDTFAELSYFISVIHHRPIRVMNIS